MGCAGIVLVNIQCHAMLIENLMSSMCNELDSEGLLKLIILQFQEVVLITTSNLHAQPPPPTHTQHMYIIVHH